MYKIVKDEPGIQEVRWNTSTHTMEIVYNKDLYGRTEGMANIDLVSERLLKSASNCALGGPGAGQCETCVENIQKVVLSSPECVDEITNDGGHVEVTEGIVMVRREAQDPFPKNKAKKITLTTSSLHEVGEKPPIPWEPIFVGLTLIGMIVGALADRAGNLGLYVGAYLVAYLTGGYFGVRASFESLKERKLDIDLLMVLAALGAAGVGAPFEGALLLFLFSFSNVLQDFALDRTRNAIKALAKLKPDTALVVSSVDDREGKVEKVEALAIGTLVQVKPGDRIPLDGILRRGSSSVDQSSITGESMPVEKFVGSGVLAGTMNLDGEFILEVTRTSGESTIAKVINLVEEARENQAKTERFLDTFEQYYAGVVIGATILAGLIPPLFFGWDWPTSFYKAITLMVAASPCALIISTPASILSAIGNAARRGILFKGGVHVEQSARIQAVAFDKTGTLTLGKPTVSHIIPVNSWTEDEILSAAASLESKSQHVLAQAIVDFAKQKNLVYSQPEGFRSESGVGVRGLVNKKDLRLGSPAILDTVDLGTEKEGISTQILELQHQAQTVVVLLEQQADRAPAVVGLLALEDKLKPGVREVIQDLRSSGIKHVVMLTGDNEAAAKVIAAEAGIDAVFPELLPEHKLDAIREIEAKFGPTAMVGDGVNDAPALAGARIGIAMGAAGTDVALETADVVLLSDDLGKIPYLIALSRATLRTLIVNLSVALGLILLMVAAIYTIDLPLPLAVIGHEGGTVLVSLNGVRLLLFNYRSKK